MQVGSLKKEGLVLNINLDNINNLDIIKSVLLKKYNLDTTILNQHLENEITYGLLVKLESLPLLRSIVNKYIYPSSYYLFQTDILDLKDSFVESNVNIVPKITYNNADIDKEMIIKDNRGKSGVYR
jgi:hypothetical protein